MKLPILHMQNGLHSFEGLINSGELKFDQDEHFPNDIKVNVSLNKFEKNITCEVESSTITHYICDRCLQNYTREFSENFMVLFHLGQKDFETEEDDVVMLSPEENEIDLKPFIIENLILSIPMKNVCDESCKGICSGCGINLNEAQCVCKNDLIDPRWEKLREFKKQ